MSKAVRKFIENLNSIDESDYGDFMRKANVYLNYLKDDLSPMPQDVRSKLFEMQLYLQFISSWEIEPTRRRIITDAMHVNDMLAAQRPDWQFPDEEVAQSAS